MRVSTGSRSGRDGRPIIVATILRPEGDTGVQTHFNTFLRYAARLGEPVRLATPFGLSPLLVYPAFAPGPLLKPISKSLRIRWYRRGHGALLKRRLEQMLDRDRRAVIYAQCPLSAKVALDLRERGYPIEVTMVVHYPVSEAEVWTAKNYIKRDDRLYAEILDFEAAVLPRLDRLVFPSRFMMREVTGRLGGVAEVPMWCIPNFVETAARDGSGAEPDGDLISIGTAEPRKNQAYLLEVLAAARSAGRRYRLTLVGGGPLERELARTARRLGVADQVHFAGRVAGAARLIPRHRAYVHASPRENLPVVLIEAMAAGRPVFAGPVGGIPEMVDDGVEGRLWPLDDAEAAAEVLTGVLEDGDRYRRAVEAARVRYRHQFTPEQVVPRLVRAIRGAETDDPA